MPKFPLALPTDFRISRLLAAMALAVLAACSTNPPQTGAAADEAQEEGDDPVSGDVQAAGPETENRSTYPNQDLTENLLYEYLLAEIAGQRGNVALAAQAYVDLAKRTRDPRIARRATEIALYARMNNSAIEAATIWHEADPTSTRALQALAGMLVSVGRYDEALPRLKELLSGSASDTANGFTQLTRTLANAQDKPAALRLTQNLAADYPKLPESPAPRRNATREAAADYPKLPESHYAVARAAVSGGDDRVALDEVRTARQLRPDWEAAVLLEAQIVQKTSIDQASALLGDFVQKYPPAREARLAYARALVSQKRFTEARAEFEKLMTAMPESTDMAFAVALLSVQLKDYDSAEKYLKGLLSTPYRDKDGVRLYLGQVAEERKDLAGALKWYGEVGEGEQYVQAQIRYAQVLAKQGKI